MTFKYLSREVLQGFDKYKYSSVDTSPLSNYVMHPFWNWLVQFLPMWIAPNVLTFAGFLLLIVKFFMFTYYDAYFYASDDSHPEYPSVPQWVWIAAALCMFWAHQLDGCDGKQARRTKTSSPLGELFDHGLDSWATLFMPLAMYSVFGRGEHSISPDRTFYVLMSLGGYQMWKINVPLTGISCGRFFEFVMYVSVWVCGVPVSLYNLYLARRDKTGKNYGVFEACRPLVPPLLEFALFTVWAQCSSYNLLSKHPRLFCLTVGTLFSNITCRIIVSGMSNTRAPAFNWLLIPLIAIVTGVLTLHLGVIELYLLVAYTIFVHAAHIHYGICVVKELADHLNIYVFSVARPSETSPGGDNK